MNLINAENITKVYGETAIFDNASFFLQEGEKIGVIGINGTGKSTLLRMLVGEEETDQGEIVVANHVVMRYLPQHPEFDPDMSSLDCVLSGNITEENRWTIESDAKTMMMRLGIRDLHQPAGQLSGGQRKRLALISALLSPADILLLDEPTNHLDNDMADWLEEYLKKWRGSLIMVTHDRYFLDQVTNCLIELDKGKIYRYETNYSGYLERKTQREDMQAASERKRQSILRTELEWIQRGARARSTKQKARIERYETLRDQQGISEESRLELSSISTRLGKTTVELDHIGKSYGEYPLIHDFTYHFLKGDRVGFIGTNGCGKSTLMKIIAGILSPDEGQVLVGQTVKIGYYAQEITTNQSEVGIEQDFAYMDSKQRVIDYVKETAEYIPTADGLISASAMLEKFLFPPEKQYNLIGKLSGGEKRRLNLLRVLASSPNVLLLDEPTNNLDIATLTILEDYLDHYEGIVAVVSHDRYFLDRTMKRIFAFEGEGRLRQYEGGYTDYASRKDSEKLPETETPKKVENEPKEKAQGNQKAQWDRGPKKLKFTYQEQRDYETIENDIAELEEKIETLEQEMAAVSTDFVKLNEIMAEKEAAEDLLNEKMDRWMYLEDLAARIAAQ